MKIAIRVDASPVIGSGHLMRCLTLADRLAAADAQVRFVCRQLPQSLEVLIREAGHECARLPALAADDFTPAADDPAHAGWLGIDWPIEADETVAALADPPGWDWLIVDHYGLDARWQRRLRGSANRIMVIDDLADRPHDCDVLLDQNAYTNFKERYVGKVPDGCRMLLGPRYALLRPEFLKLRRRGVKPREQVNRVLVFLGGGDHLNLTSMALDGIAQAGIAGLHTEVVLGALNPHITEVRNRCETLENATLHLQAPNMAQSMLAADIAIGAGGTASWERCCMGLPTLVVSFASNQVDVVKALASHEIAIDLGSSSELTAGKIAPELAALAANGPMLRTMSEKALAMVDGLGAIRVCAGLQAPELLSLRSAEASDDELTWPWRNHPETRKHFFNPAPVSRSDHCRWWQEALKMDDRILLIGTIANEPIGVLRFDIAGKDAEVSIYLAPEMTGLGLGHLLLEAAKTWAGRHLVAVDSFQALVKPENIRSRQAFMSAGFTEDHVCYSWTRGSEDA